MFSTKSVNTMTIQKNFRRYALIISCGLLAGCAYNLPAPPGAGGPTLNAYNDNPVPATTVAAAAPKPLNNSPHTPVDSAEVQLAEAAASVSSSLTSLEQVQQAATPAKQPVQPPTPSSYGMGEVVTVNWTGPVGPLVEKITELTHYNLKVLGTPPAVPIVVTINAKDVPLGDILQNAGYQCGKRADIIVYPSTKVIELRYAKA